MTLVDVDGGGLVELEAGVDVVGGAEVEVEAEEEAEEEAGVEVEVEASESDVGCRVDQVLLGLRDLVFEDEEAEGEDDDGDGDGGGDEDQDDDVEGDVALESVVGAVVAAVVLWVVTGVGVEVKYSEDQGVVVLLAGVVGIGGGASDVVLGTLGALVGGTSTLVGRETGASV